MSMNLSPNAPPPMPVGPNQAMSMVHQLSDQQLLQMIQKPTSPVTQQAALQEMQFRHQARTGPGAMAQQPPPHANPQIAQQAQQGVQQNLAQQGVDKLGGGIGQLPAQAVEGMAGGGIVAFSGEDGSSVQSPPPSTGFWGSLFGPTYEGQDTGQGMFPTSRPPAPQPQPAAPPPSNEPGFFARWAAAMGGEGMDDDAITHAAKNRIQLAQALNPPVDRNDPRNYDSYGNLKTAPGYQDPNLRAFRAPPPAPAAPGAAPQPPGLGTTTTPEDPQADMHGLMAIYRQFPDRMGTANPGDETIQKQLAATEAAKRANSGLSLLHAGAAMLQSTSPFAAVALGKGVDAYATSKEAGMAAEQAGLAHAAQQQGENYKTQMQYAGSVDGAMAHAVGLNYMQSMMKGLQLNQQAQAQKAATYEQAFKQLAPSYEAQIQSLSQAAMSNNPDALTRLQAARQAYQRASQALAEQILRDSGTARAGNIAAGMPAAAQGPTLQHGYNPPQSQIVNAGQ